MQQSKTYRYMVKKYITRDKLGDFLEKMWESGIKCDLDPHGSTIKLWSKDLDKVEYVDVVDKRTYDSLVSDIKSSLLPKGSHTINTSEV